MSNSTKDPTFQTSLTRRQFLERSAAATALPALGKPTTAQDSKAGTKTGNKSKPNIIIYISDQFRWDAVGAYGLNSMRLTPNLDSMAQRGTLFRSHITNQPLCAPSRACLFTGQYQNVHGVWENGLGLAADAVTIATAMRQAGYTANYIGKWHLAPNSDASQETLGPVVSQHRGGFLDFWEGSNVPELTSHPYEGNIWNAEGEPIHFEGVYRVDFLTERAVHFLRTVREPFLLVISQLEPHFQNDCNCFVAPKGYADRYSNPFVPKDLEFFSGDWQKQLPDYYGCINRIDESVGTILKTISERGIDGNTIVAFLSDHGCHFRTRNSEYKRSPHESSIHIPLVIQGPGFDNSMVVPELTCQIDVAPTLLDAAGIPVPASMQGRSAMAVVRREIQAWPDEVYIQISESMTARALRTPEWTYVVVAPPLSTLTNRPSSQRYLEYQMYNLFDDPHQLLNLAGRRDNPNLVHYDGGRPLGAVASHLRQRLLARMKEAGEPEAEIEERILYP
jgi:arylsulfatase A-like enzyme